MATKRATSDSSSAPPAKRSALSLAPLDIGPAAGEEDLDLKVLQVCFPNEAHLTCVHVELFMQPLPG